MAHLTSATDQAVRLSSTLSSYIVNPQQVYEALENNAKSDISTASRTIPISAAWFMPNDVQGREGPETFQKRHIPGSRFFDIDHVKDHASPYPHMLPTSEDFSSIMQDMGLRRDDNLIVYDTEELGLFSAPRVAWTLRVFGHPTVHVLNNFRLWCHQGYPTTHGKPAPISPTKYPVPKLRTEMLADFAEMHSRGLRYGKEGAEKIQILDARSKGRWEGTSPEPRPGLRSGHMPGSTSLPFEELLDSQTKTLLPPNQIREVLLSHEVDEQKSVIASCGTGVTAAIIEAAIRQAGFCKGKDCRLYDGSWT